MTLPIDSWENSGITEFIQHFPTYLMLRKINQLIATISFNFGLYIHSLKEREKMISKMIQLFKY